MSSAPPLPKPLTDPTRLDEITERLVPGGAPKVLQVDAPAWAVPRDCFVNVAKLVNQHTGETVYGWSLMETIPEVLMEAESHAVYRGPDGTLRDPTPKEIPALEPLTVFLADPSLTYEGRQIDNVRVPLKDDQLVRSFIRTQERKFEALNRGDLAEYHGPVTATPELERIHDLEQRFLARILQRHCSV